MIGRTLSHYKVVEEISRGGMGIVYRAVDVKLNREVALKILPPELVADPDRKRRFVQEAQAAAALHHPHIAVIHEIDEADGVTFIAMELVDGEKLSDRVAREKLSVAKSLDLATEVAEGLARAHDKGIAHRDLKPANIMVTEDGHAKIIDFGLAKLVEPVGGGDSEAVTAIQEETEAGKVMGTVSYMSPEQARGQKVDHRTDIFSFGIVLHLMLTGEHPFQRSTGADTLSAILTSPAPSLVPSVTGLTTPELQGILDRCLAKGLSERYKGMKDVVAALHQVKQEAGAPSARRPSLLPSRSALIAAAVVVTVLAVAAALFWRSDRGPALPELGRMIQVTRAPGLEVDPAISPDGKMIAYAAGPLGQTKIYVQQVAGGRAIPLTEDFPGGHRWPQWSPDGTRISFAVHGEESIETFVVPALGGNPRRLVGAAPGEYSGGVVWSPDGSRVGYIASGELLATGDAIYVRSVEGGEPNKVAEAHEPFPLSWSPDGSKIAFAAANTAYIAGQLRTMIANIAPSSLWVVPVTGGDPVRVTEDPFLDHSPVWTPDGRHLLFVSDRGGGRDVYQVSIEASGAPSGPAVRVTTGLDVHTLSLSADGSRLAYSVLVTRQNIWSIRIPPISKDGPISIAQATPVTTGSQVIEGIGVSSDGRWVVFGSNRSGNQDIFKVPIEGGEPEQLTTDPAEDFLPDFSPDGSEIVFYSFRTGNRDLFVMSADGGSLRQLTRHPGQDRYPGWSPGGTQVTFHSDRSGRPEVYVVSTEGGELAGEEPRQLTSEGGLYPRWSPDGRLIAFNQFGNGLFVISPEGGEAHRLVHHQNRVFPAWSPDSQTVYYKTRDPEGAIWSIPAAGGEPKLLVGIDDPLRTSTRHEFATDGDQLFFTLTEHESDVWVMELASTR
jgi:Tol biopolymer transport system component/predicted Ser/Thr protein kinase